MSKKITSISINDQSRKILAKYSAIELRSQSQFIEILLADYDARQRKKKAKTQKKKKENDYFLFNEFWQEYPVKTDKAKSKTIWEKINPDDDLAGKIIHAVKQQKEEKENLKAAGSFVKNWKIPTTWLNNKCWEDEVLTEKEIKERKNNEDASRGLSTVDRANRQAESYIAENELFAAKSF